MDCVHRKYDSDPRVFVVENRIYRLIHLRAVSLILQVTINPQHSIIERIINTIVCFWDTGLSS